MSYQFEHSWQHERERLAAIEGELDSCSPFPRPEFPGGEEDFQSRAQLLTRGAVVYASDLEIGHCGAVSRSPARPSAPSRRPIAFSGQSLPTASHHIKLA